MKKVTKETKMTKAKGLPANFDPLKAAAIALQQIKLIHAHQKLQRRKGVSVSTPWGSVYSNYTEIYMSEGTDERGNAKGPKIRAVLDIPLTDDAEVYADSGLSIYDGLVIPGWNDTPPETEQTQPTQSTQADPTSEV